MNAQRRAAAKPMTATVTSTRKRDLNTGSARGSEERTAPAAAPTRGTKRGREYEGIDKVSKYSLLSFMSLRILRGCVVKCGGLPLAR
jgi:mortality factor 4-like protein 1